jgi:acetoin utilization deacetylase AcuC-like enzyme
MLLFYSDHIQLPLPAGHRFPLPKYALLRERVLSSGFFNHENLVVPPPATFEQLSLVHEPDYIRKVLNGELTVKELRRVGFPWSPGLVERSLRSVGATIAACRAAIEDGTAANLAGGTHHAYPDHGEGYCVFNDVAVGARLMQVEGHARQVLIVDLDVHQGNGTAAIFAGDQSVFTFSMHGAKNFPFHKETSDLDIALPDGTGDEAYLDALEPALALSLEKSAPEFAIYLAGADPYLADSLGRLALTRLGLAQRDRLVLETFRRLGIPLAITMSGGYAKNITDTVDIQFQTLKIAAGVYG